MRRGEADRDLAGAVHGLDAVDHQVGERLLDLAGVDLGLQVGGARLQLERHAPLLRHRSQQVQGLPREPLELASAPVGGPAAGKIEELADDFGDPVDLFDDGPAAVGCLGAADLAARDHLGAPGDHVERRPQLMGDARGQRPHRAQPVGVAELLDGPDARGRLPLQPVVGLAQPLAHAVHLGRQLPDLVALSHAQRAAEIAGPDAPGEVPQPARGASDQDEPEGTEREDAGRRPHRGPAEHRPHLLTPARVKGL